MYRGWESFVSQNNTFTVTHKTPFKAAGTCILQHGAVNCTAKRQLHLHHLQHVDTHSSTVHAHVLDVAPRISNY